MNFEQPNTSNIQDDLDAKLAKARADAATRESSLPKKDVETVEGATQKTPASMAELLAGLQKETEGVKESPQAVAAVEVPKPVTNETAEINIEDPVRAELGKKLEELKAKYKEGHEKFGDAWTTTPEFQALGAERSRFQEEYKSKGFTAENGVLKPIDKERVERERQMVELNEAAGKLVVKSDVETGKDVYAVLSGNTDLYKKTVEKVLQATIEREEISLKNETLIIANDSHTNDAFRTPREKEDYLTYKKTETARRIEYLRSQIADLNDPKKLGDMMERDKENLKDGRGVRQKGESGGFAVTQDRHTIENPAELIRGLTKRVDSVFDYRKQPTGGGIERALDTYDYPMESTRVLKGVALAAVEAGDVKTATEALAFTENLDPLSPEQMEEMMGAVDRLTPEQKRAFVVGMEEGKKRPHREYKREVETRSKDPIYSR